MESSCSAEDVASGLLKKTGRGLLHVAEMARRANVTPATVRYYSRIGLLNPGREAGNGYRRFSGDDLRRVRFIRKAQAVGLTINDIRSILEEAERGGAPCDLVMELVQARLDEVRRQRIELEAREARIAQALRDWNTGAADRVHDGLCPLIEQVDVGVEARVVEFADGPADRARGTMTGY